MKYPAFYFMLITPVWTSPEASLFIFIENAIGVALGMSQPGFMANTDLAALEYLFGENVTVSLVREFSHRKETGKHTHTLVEDGMKYSCSIGGLHCRANEIDQVGLFYPTKRFTVVLYMMAQDLRTHLLEQHILRHSMFSTASITTNGGKAIAQGVKIEAEDFIQYQYQV